MRKWLCIFIVLLCGGCSSKLAYDNLDWLIYWYMDDYVELKDRQEALFDEKLDSWIDWHRSEELSKYQQQLQQLQQHIKNDALDRQTIAWHLDKGKNHIDAIRNKLAPELAQLASRLDDEQVIYLFAALERENEGVDCIGEIHIPGVRAITVLINFPVVNILNDCPYQCRDITGE